MTTTSDVREPIEAIPVETATANPLTTALAWVAVVVATVGISFWVWNRWIDPPVGGTIDQYVNDSAGVVFEDPTAEFRVTYPTDFVATRTPNDLGEIVTVSDRVGDYEFSVTKTPQPASTLDNFESALNTLAGQLAADADAEIVSQTPPVPLLDVGYKEVVYRKGDTTWRAQLELLQDRLYTIIARLPGDDEDAWDRFKNSFQILGDR